MAKKNIPKNCKLDRDIACSKTKRKQINNSKNKHMITNLLKQHGKAGKRQRSRWLGIWLLFTLLLTVGQRAEAQDFRIADPQNYTVIASEKGYISFQIP